jgi:RNA polymerase sigma factor (sigma-70 family)
MDPAGDEFERLVDEHARLIAGAIRRVCGRRHASLVPDVEQEVRLALWKRLGRGKKIDHPVSYIYKVALTTALAVLRGCAPAIEVPSPADEGARGEREGVPPARTLLPAERRYLLSQVLEGLPEPQSRALKAWLAGFNHREVARMYGWSESVARHNIYRGLEAAAARVRAEREP